MKTMTINHLCAALHYSNSVQCARQQCAVCTLRTLSGVRSGDTMIFGRILSEHELSNFYKCSVNYKDQLYSSSEQSYQHAKAVQFGDTNFAEAIMRSPRPAHQKFLASKIKGYVHDQ